jgi:molybdopterin/thiamine biosynthesis adenylyltransferase
MSPPVELRATLADWSTLHNHLFPGDKDEHGAALLCGIAQGDRGTRLLVREVVCAVDGRDFVPGTRGYRLLTGEFVTQMIRRAKNEGLVYLAVHSHGGTTSVGFSGPDFASHERGYPTLLQVSGQPVGALVLAERAVAGDIWLQDGSRIELNRTAVVGSRLEILTPTPTSDDPVVAAEYHRQSLLFGQVGQEILRNAKVAVVGAGGVGMLLVQLLARLGVGHLVVVDPDRVDPTNLPRLPEATRLDAIEYLDRDGLPEWIRSRIRRHARPKIQVAQRIARRANRKIKFEGILGDIADEPVARRITDCDFIFLAADTMLARSVVNQISHQYLVPCLQVGSKPVIDKKTGRILDVFAVVRTLGSAPSCLLCGELIDPIRLSEESLRDPVQIANQRYVDDPDVHAPSVITLNAMAAGWAANDFMQFMVGIGRPPGGFRVLRTLPISDRGLHVTVQEPDVLPSCYVCGEAPMSVRAVGDGRELPTRMPAAR